MATQAPAPKPEIDSLDVDALVDGQTFGRFNLSLLFWSFLATFTDGFEISSLGFAAPHISDEWGVAPAAMGPMMSASLFGMLIGAPLLGGFGDRFGRRLAITIGCLIFGISTLAVVVTTNSDQIAWLRVITGIGMGGVMPNAIALSSELSPRRLRARLVILMFMGVTLGAAICGVVAAWLVPDFGWQSIFWVGGVTAVLIGLAVPFVLPESVKFLAMRGRRAEAVRLLARMRPDLKFSQDSTLIVHREAEDSGTIGALFSRGLAPVTLLLWVCFATTLLANFFLASWLPSLFRQMGIDTRTAALTATLYQFGAAFGGLAMSFLLDRFGFLAIAGMLLLAVPAVLSIGIEGLPPATLGLLVAFAGFCVLGGQFGTNASAGMVYPTNCRARGLGLAFAVGRIGSVVGPILGASLIGLKLPIMALLAVMAVPMLAGAAAAFMLGLIARRRLASWRPEEMALPAHIA